MGSRAILERAPVTVLVKRVSMHKCEQGQADLLAKMADNATPSELDFEDWANGEGDIEVGLTEATRRIARKAWLACSSLKDAKLAACQATELLRRDTLTHYMRLDERNRGHYPAEYAKEALALTSGIAELLTMLHSERERCARLCETRGSSELAASIRNLE